MKYTIKISVDVENHDGTIDSYGEEVEKSLPNLAFNEAEALLEDLERLIVRREREEANILPDDEDK